VKVGILGATGLVGQQLVSRLEGHPWFELVALAASERSKGLRYGEATSWMLGPDPPRSVAGTVLCGCGAEDLAGCELLLSALDASAAGELEPLLTRAGFPIVSNASAFRQAPDVPLLIPEINADHLALIDSQRTDRSAGFLVTNPNCSVTGLALALAPLHRAFTVRRVVVTTLQAVSGAGLSGPRALDLVDNVVPFIRGEEEKIESELTKILGRMEGARLCEAELRVSAHCHRVAVQHGHLEAVSVELERSASPEQAARTLAEFEGGLRDLDLPSAPSRPIVVRSESDRPQPRLDRDTGSGMSVVVGRLRPCPVLGLKLELLSHNTVRGAAGGTLLNAELLVARGWLEGRGST